MRKRWVFHEGSWEEDYAAMKARIRDRAHPALQGEVFAVDMLIHETSPVEFADVLQTVREHAGLTVREVADRMGVSIGNVSQYLYRRRGVEGTGTVHWFLRYMQACGATTTVTFSKGIERRKVPSDGAPDHSTLKRTRGTRVRLDDTGGSAGGGHRPVLLAEPDGRTDADRLRRAVAAATGSPESD